MNMQNDKNYLKKEENNMNNLKASMKKFFGNKIQLPY